MNRTKGIANDPINIRKGFKAKWDKPLDADPTTAKVFDTINTEFNLAKRRRLDLGKPGTIEGRIGDRSQRDLTEGKSP